MEGILNIEDFMKANIITKIISLMLVLSLVLMFFSDIAFMVKSADSPEAARTWGSAMSSAITVFLVATGASYLLTKKSKDNKID